MFKFAALRTIAVVLAVSCAVIALAILYSRQKDSRLRAAESRPVVGMTFSEKAFSDPALIEQKIDLSPVIIEAKSDDYVAPLREPIVDMIMPASELAQPDHEQILSTASQYDSLRKPAVRDPNSPENKALVSSLVTTRIARDDSE